MSKPERHRQFTLRTLLLVVTLVCFVIAAVLNMGTIAVLILLYLLLPYALLMYFCRRD